MSVFYQGFFLGLAIAAPVGPIGLLCLRRSWEQGQRMGLASGLGAAVADALFGAVAGFGLKAVSDFLISQRLVLAGAGGMFLCLAGLRTLWSKPGKSPATGAAVTAGSLFGAFTSTLFLTLSNPMTILFMAALLASLGLVANNAFETWTFIGGVFLGSASWWFALSFAAASAGRKLGEKWLPWINRVSGVLLLACGLAAFVSMAHDFGK